MGADGGSPLLSIRRIFPELNSNDMVLSIVKGINLPAPPGEGDRAERAGWPPLPRHPRARAAPLGRRHRLTAACEPPGKCQPAVGGPRRGGEEGPLGFAGCLPTTPSFLIIAHA